jgi:hypothetical protein
MPQLTSVTVVFLRVEEHLDLGVAFHLQAAAAAADVGLTDEKHDACTWYMNQLHTLKPCSSFAGHWGALLCHKHMVRAPKGSSTTAGVLLHQKARCAAHTHIAAGTLVCTLLCFPVCLLYALLDEPTILIVLTHSADLQQCCLLPRSCSPPTACKDVRSLRSSLQQP